MEGRLQRLERRIMELTKLIVEELYGDGLGEDGAVSEVQLERLKEAGLLEDFDMGMPDDSDEDDEPEEQPRERWLV